MRHVKEVQMILPEQSSLWIVQTQTIFWSAWTPKTEASAKCQNGVINKAAATSELEFQAPFE
jgi:hypothetical protein